MFWFIGFLFFCLYALSFKYAPQTHSDAVVVLTGGSNRIKTGLQLIQEKKADYLLISGVNKEVTKSKLFKNTSDDILNKITLGYEALDTKGNAKEVDSWIKEKNIKSILLVTSFYHMPRSIFEITQLNKNIQINPLPVFPKSFNSSVDWIKTRYAWLLFIEYHKVIFTRIKTIF
jgi:uncharacterized SAM-binding protein YcdF (DUF218 family)